MTLFRHALKKVVFLTWKAHVSAICQGVLCVNYMEALRNREDRHGKIIRYVMGLFPLGYNVKQRTFTALASSCLLFNNPLPSCLICAWVRLTQSKARCVFLSHDFVHLIFFFFNTAENSDLVQKRGDWEGDFLPFYSEAKMRLQLVSVHRILPKG